MIRVWIDARNLAALDNTIGKLRAVERELRDRRAPMDEIKRTQNRRWEVNFDSEGGLYDGWPALADRTQEDRDAGGYGRDHPILVRDGGLRASFISQNQAARVTDTAVFWTFRNQPPAYPVSHNEGYPNPSGGAAIPPRVLWDIDSADENAAAKIMERAVNAVITRYFG